MSKYYINPQNNDIALLTDREAKEFYGYIPASDHLAALRADNAKLREALGIALHRADQARYHTAEAVQPITAEWLEGIITEARRVLEETSHE